MKILGNPLHDTITENAFSSQSRPEIVTPSKDGATIKHKTPQRRLL